ncbi:alpha/beta hydrolase [Rhodohalobacter barkolensis]|uniref:Alpha/beta hydrolase n=1 Tax=Rhodohalobacter barkolensis TaxID=2053187 RepID=A0A2N0VHM8_9BACT|nr:alpha/beta hydrolase [Rhodohalobacter barkolensis]PKD43689.1 alpha/beta hydrolase [Rhodohalobacter barkolensis]
MKNETIKIKDSESVELHCSVWLPDTPPKSVLIVVHGMAEHGGRYHEFASFLTDHGIAVLAHDHRGHGKSASNGLGFVNSDDAFHTLVDGIHSVYKFVEHKYSGLPVFLLGHSMGSFLVQRFIQLYPVQLQGIIYSGSNGKPPFLLHFGIILSGMITSIFGSKKKSPLINYLTFGKYNKPFKPNRTDFDWLSRDDEIVDNYVQDPSCGFIYSASFYHDLFRGLKTLQKHKPFAGYSKLIPIFLISGDQDPVSNMGKGVHQLKSLLEKSGAESVDMKIYPGGRHEMLLEINRDKVMNDVLLWMQNQLDV